MSQTDATVIAAHCFIKGQLQCDGPTVISGRVEGMITATDALEIAADGAVEGDIKGVLVDIQGSVKGNVFATRACRLGATARVAGELRAANLAIAEGASFVGQVFVGESVSDEPPESAAQEEIEQPAEHSFGTSINRIETLSQESEPLTLVTSVPASPQPAVQAVPTVRVLPQTINSTLNRSPKIIKAR